MTSIEFYNESLIKLSKYKNIRYKIFDPKQNIGVGNGRINAISLYKNEDYILQVDPHTMFEKNWDVKILKLYKKSLKETKNNKTILSCYLPGYEYVNGKRVYVNNSKDSHYSIFTEGSMVEINDKLTPVPRYWDRLISDFPNKPRKKILPAVKYSAHFMFSNKEYINHKYYDKSYLLEEEVIETINLLNEGYSLCFPNSKIPLAHKYYTVLEERQTGEEISGKTAEEYDYLTNLVFHEFISNPDNINKINKFEKYSNMNIRHGCQKEWYIPERHNE